MNDDNNSIGESADNVKEVEEEYVISSKAVEREETTEPVQVENEHTNIPSNMDENVELFRSDDLESYLPMKPSSLLAFQKKEESSEDEDYDHHLLSPVVRKHIKDTHLTPIGLTKNKKLFMELFHQTMPKTITTTENPEEKQSLAATMLQKVVRGWVIRKRYAKRRIDTARLSAEYADDQGLIEGWKLKKKKLTEGEMNEHCKKIQHAIEATITRIKAKEIILDESARVIQKAWRNYYRIKRDQIRQKPIPPNESVQLIQRITNSKYFKNRESFEEIIESLANLEIFGLPTSYEFTNRTSRSYTFKMTIF